MDNLLLHIGIEDHFRFMVLEVTKQVENTRKLLGAPDENLRESIELRDDYIDNLKSIIENNCFSALPRLGEGNRRLVDLLRAVTTISNNLERVADYAVNIVEQTEHLKDFDFVKRFSYEKFFREVIAALELVFDALSRQDTHLAFKICRSEFCLDALYKVQFSRILEELRTGKNTENLITSHLILRYLERMGDSLLNIGEAIIFAAVGERFKIHQYEALKAMLDKSGMEMPISDVEFQSIWGTRSGCRIGRIQGPRGGGGREGDRLLHGVLFKEGTRKKLLQERENIERWEAILPGLPPRIIAQQQEDSQASLLIEYLGGCTFQDVVLSSNFQLMKSAAGLLQLTLREIWEQTLSRAPVCPGFLGQIRKRLDDIYRLHPELQGETAQINDLCVRSFSDLLTEAEHLESELMAPYTVFIHGDFNINNIVYDHEGQRMHFIDLHRSKQSDPLQDVSVFLVSNLRLPVFDPAIRSALNWVVMGMFRFARQFAHANGDYAFDGRLALGLARSLVTSTRFELNEDFARALFLRGKYLLEKLAAYRGPSWEGFQLPEAVLVY